MDDQREYGMVNNRVFEVLASGALLLSEHFNELESLLGPWVRPARGAAGGGQGAGQGGVGGPSDGGGGGDGTGSGGACGGSSGGAACYLRSPGDLQACVDDAAALATRRNEGNGGNNGGRGSVHGSNSGKDNDGGGGTAPDAGAATGGGGSAAAAWAAALGRSGCDSRAARRLLVATGHTYAHRAPQVLAAAAVALHGAANRTTVRAASRLFLRGRTWLTAFARARARRVNLFMFYLSRFSALFFSASHLQPLLLF